MASALQASLTVSVANGLAMKGRKLALVGADSDHGPVMYTGTYGLGGLVMNSGFTSLANYAGTGVTSNFAGTTIATTSGDAGWLGLYDANDLTQLGTAAGASSTACPNIQVSYLGYFEFSTLVATRDALNDLIEF